MRQTLQCTQQHEAARERLPWRRRLQQSKDCLIAFPTSYDQQPSFYDSFCAFMSCVQAIQLQHVGLSSTCHLIQGLSPALFLRPRCRQHILRQYDPATGFPLSICHFHRSIRGQKRTLCAVQIASASHSAYMQHPKTHSRACRITIMLIQLSYSVPLATHHPNRDSPPACKPATALV
jgi:hypothetical protein